jgi:RNA polymerase sigma-70 factor (ECF subfamily)
MTAHAQAREDEAFRELTEPLRRELQLHCYRIVGSMQDAEDLVQETLLAAWRGLDGFEGRATVRTWLYRIATNRCLNALRTRSRRTELEPYPDVLLDLSPGPAARYEARESVELAFIAALQGLPPRQRAALVLRDVLGFHTAEIAAMLETGETAVKGALQRARATLQDREFGGAPQPHSAEERRLVARFADATEAGDVDALVALLTDDALLTMPPMPLVIGGPAAIAEFLRERNEARGAPLRLLPTRANTQPAFGAYHAATARASGLFVLTLDGDAISAITWFSATGVLRRFGLPPSI